MPPISVMIIVLFFSCAGIAHFIKTETFIMVMPSYLSCHRELVYISGMFELLGAIGLIFPASRQLAGYGLMALCVAVFPANIHMAVNADQFPEISLALLYLRLPLQILLIGFIAWATRVSRVAPQFSRH